jgi:bifunctional DNA-binding transcriptional regulator/antitoxin component of YhaV-PrlF toxin-antitoxin module
VKTTTIVIRKQGRWTLPAELREKYGVKVGDTFSLIDLDGSFLFTPRASQVTRLGDRIEQILREENLVPDDFLQSLEDDREQYFHEHFSKS